MIRLESRDVDIIRRHGGGTYPYECCGILLGHSTGNDKTVHLVRELANEREDSRHNRFLITPETLFRAEKEARSLGLDIVGFYHSHPDAPARPSEFDREHAWPTYSYLILAVAAGQAGEMTSWVLSHDRTHFESEEIRDVVEV
jgi:proteasome lid subunit RPN8/RPN11